MPQKVGVVSGWMGQVWRLVTGGSIIKLFLNDIMGCFLGIRIAAI